ncbi:macrolide ABC transporter permease [Actinophytocola xinjiangensis]|uniref:Macrolide ABC transporter permease n=1 Tax=Actinophytocola xinjiangensis TaxID=485602 RepID=A0A7Z1AVY4_9PSEU|nr:ABC transporter permease [Actinophytocola xinjiangensis]OLF05910.1 macrolide ABC transporter permease [Actinophytocola xinjiangensis]
MNWSDTVASGLDAIRAHRLRSVLTMLGIVIGVSSVILTVGLGLGAQDRVRAEIDALGSNLLIVSPGSATSAGGLRGGFGSASTLTVADAAALADPTVAPDVAEVAPVTSEPLSLVAGTRNWTASVVGTTPAWSSVRGRTLAAGRFLTEDDQNVAVLGQDTVGELFPGGNPLGETVTVGGTPLTVVGVLEPTGASGESAGEDDLAVVPLRTAQRITGSAGASVSTIYVRAASADVLSAAHQEITALLTALHDVEEADFTVASQESLLETANATNRTLTVLLGGVAAISLLVGGIGVMNIMLVAVTERVREIGLRKALGATARAVRRQFLVEAGVLGAAGGLIGVGVGVGGALLLPGLIDQPVSVSPLATVAAIGVALVIGIGFGVYPAGRAARLTPIDALRGE